MTVSAVLITKNEERHLEECLKTLSFCSEVIVVDSGSTDSTVEIATRLGAKVVQREWTNFTDQRNFALTQLSSASRWVLSIDADERVSPELRAQIEAAVKDPGESTAYSVPRKTFHLGRWIQHGGWYPNYLVRLFDKTKGKWEGGELHEYWSTSGRIVTLSEPLLHYSFNDLADQVERNNRYSSLGATVLKKNGRVFSFPRMMGKTVSKFFETYLFKRGFLDGLPGLIIAVSAAYSVFLKWAKLWEMERGPGRAEG